MALDGRVCVCVWECILQIRILGKNIFEYVMKLQISAATICFDLCPFLCCVFSRLISAPTSPAPKDIAVLIMEMISAANAQEVATNRIVIKCHER